MRKNSLWEGRELPGKLPKQLYEIDKESPAYKRVSTGSFKIFERIISEYSKLAKCDLLRFDWLCVCGRQESIDIPENGFLEKYKNGLKIDVAQYMEDLGQTSIEHLQKDEFTEQEIKQIRIGYD